MFNRVLVTGGAGFIGSHLVDRLMSKNFDVVVLDNFSSGRLENLSQHFDKPNFHLIEGDVRSKTVVKKALDDVDVVFHLAAVVSVNFSVKNPLLANQVNVDGTLVLLRKSVKANVKRFVYASSCAVYGEPAYLPVSEEHPTRPISPHGVSKHVAEHYCRVFCEVHGLETICLRLFNVYGPRQVVSPYSGVITKFVDGLKRGRQPTICGMESKQGILFVWGMLLILGCVRYVARIAVAKLSISAPEWSYLLISLLSF